MPEAPRLKRRRASDASRLRHRVSYRSSRRRLCPIERNRRHERRGAAGRPNRGRDLRRERRRPLRQPHRLFAARRAMSGMERRREI